MKRGFSLFPFLFIMVVLMDCKPGADSPSWEVTDLTDAFRQNAGGNFAPLSLGMTHYEIMGPDTGRVVVLVHGSTLPMWTWDRQMEILADAGFRVLRYDHFGRGYSERPDADYTIDLYRNQLHELLGFLKINKPFALVGISFGCAIIANYAATYPDPADRMVFTAPAVDPFNEVTRLIATSSIGAAFVKNQLKKQVEGRVRQTLRERGMPDTYADMFIEQASIKGFQRSLISFFHNAAIADYRPYYKKTGETVKNIMLIWGDNDKTVRKGQIHAFNEAIPNAKVHVLKGIGHLAPFEATEQFNVLLISFFANSNKDNALH
jgi:pimeloyl-ACP methyl ester carboxylesterase